MLPAAKAHAYESCRASEGIHPWGSAAYETPKFPKDIRGNLSLPNFLCHLHSIQALVTLRVWTWWLPSLNGTGRLFDRRVNELLEFPDTIVILWFRATGILKNEQKFYLSTNKNMCWKDIAWFRNVGTINYSHARTGHNADLSTNTLTDGNHLREKCSFICFSSLCLLFKAEKVEDRKTLNSFIRSTRNKRLLKKRLFRRQNNEVTTGIRRLQVSITQNVATSAVTLSAPQEGWRSLWKF